MKKVALVFVLAVFAPSLVLAWLAVRSARDQQIVVTRQQTLLYQGAADALAKDVRSFMGDRQREFAQIVEDLRRNFSSADLASRFDALCVRTCPSADVGFAVNTEGDVLSPSLFDRAQAREFRLNNDRFLGNRESVAVYWNSPKEALAIGKSEPQAPSGVGLKYRLNKNDLSVSTNVVVVKEMSASKVFPEETAFKELIGDSFEGTIARFLQNKLTVMLWYRSPGEPELIYGAQLNLSNIVARLKPLIRLPESLRQNASVALLNDAGKVVAGQSLNQPVFVTSEIGHVLPHWRISVYLNTPEVLARGARSAKLALSLGVAAMIIAIGVGSTLIVADVKRQLALARLKTDFVSNVSHELKTPLTSIRMFSELLSEGKITNEKQRQQFLQIIGSETARLTRLINNVLDFARMERGEKEYKFAPCDICQIVRDTVELYRPQLEATGFSVGLALPETPLLMDADCDALAQVLVNLISNAEKYAAVGRELSVALRLDTESKPHAMQLRVMDRGSGVPRGSEEKIFEQFYRAHDSLSSGIQGSGLGLTLARQIVRAHGGDVRYEPREGGGSCFVITLPIKTALA